MAAARVHATGHPYNTRLKGWPVATIMKPEQASEAILRGVAPDGLIVDGELSFSTYYQRSKQSAPLTRLPDDLQVGKLHLRGCGDLRALPKRLRCEQLEIYDSAITWLPADLQVSNSLTWIHATISNRCHMA